MNSDLLVGPWGARFGGRWFPCAVGRGGIGEKRAEGDGVTPAGSHRIEAVFYRQCIWDLFYRPDRLRWGRWKLGISIGLRDGWSDDPSDPAYNQRIPRPRRFGHEALRRPDPMYDLIAVLDWNRYPVVPGRGSAIFLHVWRRPRVPTAGCVGFQARDLAWILRRWTRRSRVVVHG